MIAPITTQWIQMSATTVASMPAWSALTGRIPHELLCRLGPHLRRVYRGGGDDSRAPEEGVGAPAGARGRPPVEIEVFETAHRGAAPPA